MVRGTYLPWPNGIVRFHLHRFTGPLLTSLGEEGAEALIGVGSFALGCQVAIGLSLVSIDLIKEG